MAKRGRPSKYTEKLVADICARIAMGESVRSVCRDPAMPSAATMFNWIHAKPDFLERYTRATTERAHAHHEDILEIADNPDPDADVQRDKLRVDVRKWSMARMLPSKFGDKQTVNHGVDDDMKDFLALIDGKRA